MIDSGWVSVGIVAVTSIAGAGITIGMVKQGQKDFAARLEAITQNIDGKLSVDVHNEVVRRLDGEILGVRGEIGSVRGEVKTAQHAIRSLEQTRMQFPPARGGR